MMFLDANARLTLGRSRIDSQLEAAERDRQCRSLAKRHGQDRQQEPLLQRALRRSGLAQARAQ
jgi:hypothetical protein